MIGRRLRRGNFHYVCRERYAAPSTGRMNDYRYPPRGSASRNDEFEMETRRLYVVVEDTPKKAQNGTSANKAKKAKAVCINVRTEEDRKRIKLDEIIPLVVKAKVSDVTVASSCRHEWSHCSVVGDVMS